MVKIQITRQTVKFNTVINQGVPKLSSESGIFITCYVLKLFETA